MTRSECRAIAARVRAARVPYGNRPHDPAISAEYFAARAAWLEMRLATGRPCTRRERKPNSRRALFQAVYGRTKGWTSYNKWAPNYFGEREYQWGTD